MANILDIIPYKILPVQNGGQKSIAMFCSFLGRQNTVTAVSTADNDSSLAQNYTMLPLFNTTKWRYAGFGYFFKLKKIIKERNIEYVITEHPYMAWMGYLLSKTTGIKWYQRSHNIEYERFRSFKKWWWPILKLYEQWAYTWADKVLFVTEEDVAHAVKNMKVDNANAITVPFGIDMQMLPDDIETSRNYVYATHGIPPQTRLLLFNGALNYAPNYEAIDFIINEINPLLIQQGLQNYRIILCGKGLPERFNELKGYTDKNVLYTGFVQEIEPYFKAAHIFLNPIISGGGVKTKLVEAIGFNNTVISSATGAIGVSPALCGHKLIKVPDNDAAAFAEAIPSALEKFINTPSEYYEYFYWGNIIKRMQYLFEEKSF